MRQEPKTPQRVADAPQKPSRDTATFTPYYWEAYNEIVNPRRFNHYLLTKWLPELGAVGLAVVLVLRDRCYHNTETGVLRDTCEMTMEELAQAVGCSRAHLFKQFSENQALHLFVRRIKQRQMVDGIPRQAENRYHVSMDEPIHPGDMERYEELRAQKESERIMPQTVWKEAKKTPESTTKTQAVPESTVKTATGSTVWTPTESTTCTAIDKLPSGDLNTKELDNATCGECPPINPPRGKDAEPNPELMQAFKSLLGEGCDANPPVCDERQEVWSKVCQELEGKIPIPSLKAWVAPSRLESLTTTAEGATATIRAGTKFGRDQLDGKWGDVLTAAFREVLGVGVDVRFVAGGGNNYGTNSGANRASTGVG